MCSLVLASPLCSFHPQPLLREHQFHDAWIVPSGNSSAEWPNRSRFSIGLACLASLPKRATYHEDLPNRQVLSDNLMLYQTVYLISHLLLALLFLL